LRSTTLRHSRPQSAPQQQHSIVSAQRRITSFAAQTEERKSPI
jgi:hypothetical protein